MNLGQILNKPLLSIGHQLVLKDNGTFKFSISILNNLPPYVNFACTRRTL